MEAGGCALVDDQLVDLFLVDPSSGDENVEDVAIEQAWLRAVSHGRLDAMLQEERGRAEEMRARIERIDQGSEGDMVRGLQVTERSVEALDAVHSRSTELLETVQREMENVEPIAQAVGPLLSELEKLENAKRYATWGLTLCKYEGAAPTVGSLEQLCQGLEDYKSFAKEKKLQGSLHIGRVFASKINEFAQVLKKKLFAELRSDLKSIDWPISPTNPSLTMNPEKMASLRSHLSDLTKVQLLYISVRNGGSMLYAPAPGHRKQLVGNLWALECLAKPIVQRFKYHFGGDRDTNRVDKPEWSHNFILQAIKDHSVFLVDNAQPAVQELVEQFEGNAFVDARSHFYRIMVRSLHAYYESKWPTLEKSNALLCSMIDQAVALDKALAAQFDYCSTSAILVPTLEETSHAHWPSLVSFFESRHFRFAKWMSADLEFARKKFSGEAVKPSAWQTLIQTIGGATAAVPGTETTAERMRVPEICDHLLAILSTLAGRAASLGSLESRLLFVRMVSLPLVDDFRAFVQTRLTSLVSKSSSDDSAASWSQVLVLLNAAEYARRTLSSWQDQSLYVQVSDFQRVYAQQSANEGSKHDGSKEHASAVLDGNTSLKLLHKALRGGANVKEMFSGALRRLDRKQSTHSPADSPASVLDGSCSGLADLIHAQLNRTCDRFMETRIRPPCTAYARHVCQGGFASRETNPSQKGAAFDAMTPIKNAVRRSIQTLEKSLLPSLFVKATGTVATSLGHFFVQQIFETGASFDQNSASQFASDMQALFAEFKCASKRPENRFFRPLKDRVTLLSSPKSNLSSLEKALRKLLVSWNGDSSSQEGKHLAGLLEDGFEVSTISPQDALVLIRQRIDLR